MVNSSKRNNQERFKKTYFKSSSYFLSSIIPFLTNTYLNINERPEPWFPNRPVTLHFFLVLLLSSVVVILGPGDRQQIVLISRVALWHIFLIVFHCDTVNFPRPPPTTISQSLSHPRILPRNYGLWHISSQLDNKSRLNIVLSSDWCLYSLFCSTTIVHTSIYFNTRIHSLSLFYYLNQSTINCY